MKCIYCHQNCSQHSIVLCVTKNKNLVAFLKRLPSPVCKDFLPNFWCSLFRLYANNYLICETFVKVVCKNSIEKKEVLYSTLEWCLSSLLTKICRTTNVRNVFEGQYHQQWWRSGICTQLQRQSIWLRTQSDYKTPYILRGILISEMSKCEKQHILDLLK